MTDTTKPARGEIPLEEQILAFKMIMRGDPVDDAILDSLKSLRDAEKELPVEPADYMMVRYLIDGEREYPSHTRVVAKIDYDALRAHAVADRARVKGWPDPGKPWACATAIVRCDPPRLMYEKADYEKLSDAFDSLAEKWKQADLELKRIRSAERPEPEIITCGSCGLPQMVSRSNYDKLLDAYDRMAAENTKLKLDLHTAVSQVMAELDAEEAEHAEHIAQANSGVYVHVEKQ